MNCPIIEQTADGDRVGRCWFYLSHNGTVCPRHGEVGVEVKRFLEKRELTLENEMRFRKGMELPP